MEKVRRCDARCHTAKGNHCACWCGGKYHGAAGEQARMEMQDRFFKVSWHPVIIDGGIYAPVLKSADLDFEEKEERRIEPCTTF